MNVITMGAHILDVLVRPVSEIPPGQGTVLVEQMRMTAAGTAAGTALTFAKLGAAVRTAGAIGTDPAGDVLLSLLGSAGIDTSLVVRKTDVPTSMSVLPIRPNGERPSLHLLGATCGADGALIVGREGTQQVPAFAVDAVDTTGCGDAFSAGFVYAIGISRAPRDAAVLGNAVAALVAHGLGSDHGDFDLAAADAFAKITALLG